MDPSIKTKKKEKRVEVAATYARIAWGGLALAVLIAGVVLISAAGRATVVATYALDEHEQSVLVRVGPLLQSTPELANVVLLPGEVVESAGIGKSEKEIHATRVLAGRAGGMVTIINTTSRAQPLVATTRLLSSNGILFRITKSVVVAARGQVRVAAAADAIGAAGDIGPTRWTIPGLSRSLQQLIYAESSSAMTGGNTEVRRVDAVDISEVVAKAEIDATRAAEQSVTTAKSVFRFSRPTSSVRNLNAKEGENVAVLTAQVRQIVTHVLLDENLGNEAIKSYLRAKEGSSGNDVVEVRGGISSFELGKIYRTEGAAELKGSVKVLTRRKTDGLSLELQNALVGLSKEEALSRIRSRDGVTSAWIQLSPPWLWAMPSRPDHITVLLR